MPLKRYKRILLEGDLKAMYVEELENVPDEKLSEAAEAFYTIQGDYADALGDIFYSQYIKLKRDLAIQQAEYTGILFAIEQIGYLVPFHYTLAEEPAREKVRTLIFGYAGHMATAIQYRPDFMDLDNLETNLKRCERRSRSYVIRISLTKEDIRVMEDKFKGDGAKLNPDSIDDNLISLSDAAGYRLTDDISLYEYGKRIYRARKEAERLQNIKRKK